MVKALNRSEVKPSVRLMTYDGQEARLNAGPLCFFLEYFFKEIFLFFFGVFKAICYFYWVIRCTSVSMFTYSSHFCLEAVVFPNDFWEVSSLPLTGKRCFWLGIFSQLNRFPRPGMPRGKYTCIVCIGIPEPTHLS